VVRALSVSNIILNPIILIEINAALNNILSSYTVTHLPNYYRGQSTISPFRDEYQLMPTYEYTFQVLIQIEGTKAVAYVRKSGQSLQEGKTVPQQSLNMYTAKNTSSRKLSS